MGTWKSFKNAVSMRSIECFESLGNGKFTVPTITNISGTSYTSIYTSQFNAQYASPDGVLGITPYAGIIGYPVADTQSNYNYSDTTVDSLCGVTRTCTVVTGTYENPISTATYNLSFYNNTESSVTINAIKFTKKVCIANPNDTPEFLFYIYYLDDDSFTLAVNETKTISITLTVNANLNGDSSSKIKFHKAYASLRALENRNSLTTAQQITVPEYQNTTGTVLNTLKTGIDGSSRDLNNYCVCLPLVGLRIHPSSNSVFNYDDYESENIVSVTQYHHTIINGDVAKGVYTVNLYNDSNETKTINSFRLTKDVGYKDYLTTSILIATWYLDSPIVLAPNEIASAVVVVDASKTDSDVVVTME